MSDKIKPQHVGRKAMLVCPAVVRLSGESQSRKSALAICDARSPASIGLRGKSAECPWRKLGFLHATSSIALIAHVYQAEKPLLLDALKHVRETDQQ